MKSFALLFALALPGAVLAQQAPGAKPGSTPAVSYPPTAFAIAPPDEGSPFFAERQSAKLATSQEGQALLEGEGVAAFPRSKGSPIA